MPLALQELEQRILQITIRQLELPQDKVHLDSRFIEDLGCDSLELVELLMAFEQEFQVEIPDRQHSPLFKSIFTRRAYRIRDAAEVIFLLQRNAPLLSPGTKLERTSHTRVPVRTLFSQLGGRWEPDVENWAPPFFESLEGSAVVPQYRRRSDGMRCLLLPAAKIDIGSEEPEAQDDEGPLHCVQLDSFLIDAEPVSTTAFCRFLNSIQGAMEQHFVEWFILPPADDRQAQLQIRRTSLGWEPVAGTERMPMMLVSWFGASAYSRWANDCDWRGDDMAAPCFLPSEAQWEYAARGIAGEPALTSRGNSMANPMNCESHQPGATYTASSMPLSAVNEELGMSPFGLHHMGGNVWQWCHDWYDEQFYESPEASGPNPVNLQETGIRSERGGSWVGPAELCRSSYRRGRVPTARGRCLGFRCISDPQMLNQKR